MRYLLVGAAAVMMLPAPGAADESPPAIDGITLTVTSVTSTVDGSDQPVIVGVPESYDPGTPTPLLVGLHTWSADYRQRALPYGRQAAERGWLLVLPNFRGPNRASNPDVTEAGGSLIAQADIVDARAHMLEHFSVDESRVYITGDSGGGHMTLLMAGKHPDLWAAAAAWVPVTDLREWWELQSRYAADIVAVTGGEPGDSPEVDFEYARRSPRTFMTNLAHLPVLLGHGDRDASIPVEQSWRTFRELKDLPAHNTVLHVFSGGHTGRHTFGLDWCVEHAGSAAPVRELHLVTDESKAYYWAELTMADEEHLATADVVPGDGALSITTTNLEALALDLREQPLPEGGMAIAMRSDLPLRLLLTGLPAGTHMICEGDRAEVAEQSADRLVLLVEPAVEARTLTLTW